MRNLCRTTLSTLLTVLLVLAACSKPAGTGSPQRATPQETGTASQPAVSAPVDKAPTEASEESKKEQKRIAAPVTPAQKAPVKKQPRVSTPPAAVTEKPPVPPELAPTPIPPSSPPIATGPPAPENPPVATAPAVKHITIPVNTLIALRTIDSVDSRTDQVGQTFRASIDSDVTVDDQIAIPGGADASLKLTRVSSAGELRGKSELELQLDRIVVGKKSYAVESSSVERSAAPQGPKTARDAAIGAAIGAAISALSREAGKGPRSVRAQAQVRA
jgi:hypothetical protein